MLVGPQPPDQLVGQRRLARAAGAGDAEHGHGPAGGRLGQGRAGVGGQVVTLQAGDGPGQRPPLTGQHRLGRGRVGGQVHVADADQLVDHAQGLAVLGREDPHAGRGQPLDLPGDDHPAAPAEDLHVAGPGLGQLLGQVLEVLDVAALVGADRHPLGVLVQHRVDHLADRPVVAQVDDLGPLGLQDPPHDVDRGVVPVEQRGRGDEPDRVLGRVQGAGVGGGHGSPKILGWPTFGR